MDFPLHLGKLERLSGELKALETKSYYEYMAWFPTFLTTFTLDGVQVEFRSKRRPLEMQEGHSVVVVGTHEKDLFYDKDYFDTIAYQNLTTGKKQSKSLLGHRFVVLICMLVSVAIPIVLVLEIRDGTIDAEKGLYVFLGFLFSLFLGVTAYRQMDHYIRARKMLHGPEPIPRSTSVTDSAGYLSCDTQPVLETTEFEEEPAPIRPEEIKTASISETRQPSAAYRSRERLRYDWFWYSFLLFFIVFGILWLLGIMRN